MEYLKYSVKDYVDDPEDFFSLTSCLMNDMVGKVPSAMIRPMLKDMLAEGAYRGETFHFIAAEYLAQYAWEFYWDRLASGLSGGADG
jgi:hypothetical protein